MPVALARYSCGLIAIRHHVLPVLRMTSCFRVMTNSHKNPLTVPLYTLVQYMLSSCVCPSVCLSQAGVVSKRLNGSSLFWYGSFLPLCCKEILVSPKIRVFPSATLSQILYLTWKISPGQVNRVVNNVHGRWSLLTTLTTVDVWLDARS